MTADPREDLLERFLAAHQSFYDIRRDYRFEGRTFPAYGEFHTYGEQYVLVKRAKLWEVNTHDFLFFTFADTLDVEQLDAEVTFITEQAIKKVAPGPNHMSSTLSLVIIANQCTDEARKHAHKTRFRKNYALSLHGWTDLRLAVVDLSRPVEQGVVTNAAGKKLAEPLTRNLELAK